MPSQIELEAETARWISTYNGNDRFLHSLRRWLTNHESLTPAQMRAAVRNYQEFQAGNTISATEASMDDCTHIHNGVYTVDNGTEHITYQLYTPVRGTLAGKRIIKRKLPSGRYQGFAFLTPEGGVRLWRRFEADRHTTYVTWANLLLSQLNSRSEEDRERNPSAFSFSGAGADWSVTMSTVCRRCNRRLTTPTSIRAGIGPNCQARSFEETVAANALNESQLVSDAAVSVSQAEREVEVARRARVRRATTTPQLSLSELGTGEVL